MIEHPKKQTNTDYYFLLLDYQLGKPGLPMVTHSYSRRLPALGRKLYNLIFFPKNVDTLNIKSQKTNSRGSILGSPIKI